MASVSLYLHAENQGEASIEAGPIRDLTSAFTRTFTINGVEIVVFGSTRESLLIADEKGSV